MITPTGWWVAAKPIDAAACPGVAGDSTMIDTNAVFGSLRTRRRQAAKGQQRAHVIVVGLDKDGPMRPRTQRALYVALTRATVGASIVLTGAPDSK